MFIYYVSTMFQAEEHEPEECDIAYWAIKAETEEQAKEIAIKRHLNVTWIKIRSISKRDEEFR